MAKYERRNFKRIKLEKPSEPKQKPKPIPMERNEEKSKPANPKRLRVKKPAASCRGPVIL